MLGGICITGDGRTSEGESSTTVGDMVGGSWGILDVDNIEGARGEGGEQARKGQEKNGQMIKYSVSARDSHSGRMLSQTLACPFSSLSLSVFLLAIPKTVSELFLFSQRRP